MKTGWLVLAAIALTGCPTQDTRCDAFAFTRGSGTTTHVASCSDTTCGNGMNPPMAGQHCGSTAACRVHTAAQSRCVWLHNLEHGHVVLAYNCPDGCPEVVTELEQIFVESPFPRRVIVTPDPLLPTKVAAVVWGYSHTAETVDREAIECLMQHQDEEAPEAGVSCSQ